MADLRFVFDTNVLVSAFLFRNSTPRAALDLANEVGKLAITPAAFAEFAEVLHRPKFDRYLSQARRTEILASVMQHALRYSPDTPVVECRDPRDDKFLEVAIAAEAACLVSGDEDLLVLHPFRGIPILSPGPFVDRFG